MEAELCDSITLLFCQTFEIQKFKSIPNIVQISFYLTIGYYGKASSLNHNWPNQIDQSTQELNHCCFFLYVKENLIG